jgi:hypothetical protein
MLKVHCVRYTVPQAHSCIYCKCDQSRLETQCIRLIAMHERSLAHRDVQAIWKQFASCLHCIWRQSWHLSPFWNACTSPLTSTGSAGVDLKTSRTLADVDHAAAAWWCARVAAASSGAGAEPPRGVAPLRWHRFSRDLRVSKKKCNSESDMCMVLLIVSGQGTRTTMRRCAYKE